MLARHLLALTLAVLASFLWSSSATHLLQSNITPQEDNNLGESRKVNLSVYYESRCPDSLRFFQSQLIPTHRLIGQFMNLTLVPFGHARIVSTSKMICQHGMSECQGNRLMACVQEHGNKNETQLLDTIGCLFTSYESKSNRECLEAKMPGVSFDLIEKCSNSEESFKMMQKFETQTGRISYVPKLVLNEEYSEELQENLESRLLKTLCENISEPKPEGCKEAALSESN